jgi:outer membrane protein OmpA-like peptidoglycan-associated protein
MKKQMMITLLLMIFTGTLYSQDTEGCRDHAMFNRLPNYNITECSVNFDQVQIMMADGNEIPVEGKKTFIYYTPKEENQQPPSFYQIVKNYENAISKYGGKKIFYNSDRATLKLKSEKGDVWLSLNNFESTNGLGYYDITIVELEEMKQEIQAKDILEALNNDGRIALYINFETGKSSISAESQKIIDNIVTMLKDNPTLKISIEGHTDNRGNAASNKTLSENRAKAVMNAVISKGIPASRLGSKGWGQEKPVADNASDEGKAKNRRVEIVKE